MTDIPQTLDTAARLTAKLGAFLNDPPSSVGDYHITVAGVDILPQRLKRLTANRTVNEAMPNLRADVSHAQEQFEKMSKGERPTDRDMTRLAATLSDEVGKQGAITLALQLYNKELAAVGIEEGKYKGGYQSHDMDQFPDRYVDAAKVKPYEEVAQLGGIINTLRKEVVPAATAKDETWLAYVASRGSSKDRGTPG
jgi:hypothetical protein